jgi:hypothetical protein
MAQHDYVIANGTGAAVRSDLNGGIAAIVSNNSGATEPGTMYAYQWWPDTTTGLLKIRNAANNAWVTVGTLASANLGLLPVAGGTMTGALAVTAGTAALPGIAVSGDLNTGIFSAGSDQLAISTGGTGRLAFSNTAVTSGLPFDVPLGAVGTPSLTFTGDLNTGIYSPGADQVAISTGGTQRLNADTAAVTSTLPVVHPLGAVGTPSITFTGDLNTGIYSPAADTLAASIAGTEQWRLSSSGNLSFNSGYGSSAVAYGCRAWVNFNGTGTVAIIASGNVSSITDNGVGDYTVNYTTALPSGACAMVGTGGTNDSGQNDCFGVVFSANISTARVRFYDVSAGGLVDVEKISFLAIR